MHRVEQVLTQLLEVLGLAGMQVKLTRDQTDEDREAEYDENDDPDAGFTTEGIANHGGVPPLKKAFFMISPEMPLETAIKAVEEFLAPNRQVVSPQPEAATS